jgi:hypothetical protein
LARGPAEMPTAWRQLRIDPPGHRKPVSSFYSAFSVYTFLLSSRFMYQVVEHARLGSNVLHMHWWIGQYWITKTIIEILMDKDKRQT